MHYTNGLKVNSVRPSPPGGFLLPPVHRRRAGRARGVHGRIGHVLAIQLLPVAYKSSPTTQWQTLATIRGHPAPPRRQQVHPHPPGGSPFKF